MTCCLCGRSEGTRLPGPGWHPVCDRCVPIIQDDPAPGYRKQALDALFGLAGALLFIALVYALGVLFIG